MRINRKIRAPKVRLINQHGDQVGVVAIKEAMRMAQEAGLDLVEIAPNASPPVCKIIDYGKFRYDQTKREKESKKARHQIKVKEVKVRPNIGQHDKETKLKNARKFLTEGNKVKISCMYRGREMAHLDIGIKLIRDMCEELADIGTPEGDPKRMGRFMHVIIAPSTKAKRS